MAVYFLNPTCWVLCVGAFCATAALTPLVMRLARRIGAVDHGGYRRVHEGPKPLLGGLGIAAPLIVLWAAAAGASFFIIGQWEWVWRHGRQWFDPLYSLAVEGKSLFSVLAIGGAAIVALGVYDDVRGMRARYKLAGQLAVALFVCATGNALERIQVPFVGTVSLGGILGSLISILWIVGLINAFNLIDGIDGLATGTTLIICLGLVILGAKGGSPLIVLVGMAMAGSLLGFLIYNFNPARIFLGDSGSMFLGFAVSTLTLVSSGYKTKTAVMVLAPLLALGFPIFETLVSMLRRFVRGNPIFAADQHHTHHRLLSRGYSQTQTVLLLYGVTFLCTTASVLSVTISRDSVANWISIGLYTAAIVGIAWLAGYLRPTTLRGISERRQRNSLFSAFSRYAIQSLNDEFRRITPEEILDVGRKALGLRFAEVWLEDGSGLVVSSGVANKEEQSTFPFCLIEHIRIKTVEGTGLIILFQFERPPSSHEHQDVKACLAHLFEQVNTSNLRIQTVTQSKSSEFKVLAMR